MSRYSFKKWQNKSPEELPKNEVIVEIPSPLRRVLGKKLKIRGGIFLAQLIKLPYFHGKIEGKVQKRN